MEAFNQAYDEITSAKPFSVSIGLFCIFYLRATLLTTINSIEEHGSLVLGKVSSKLRHY